MRFAQSTSHVNAPNWHFAESRLIVTHSLKPPFNAARTHCSSWRHRRKEEDREVAPRRAQEWGPTGGSPPTRKAKAKPGQSGKRGEPHPNKARPEQNGNTGPRKPQETHNKTGKRNEHPFQPSDRCVLPRVARSGEAYRDSQAQRTACRRRTSISIFIKC